MFSSTDYLDKIITEKIDPYFLSHKEKQLSVGLLRGELGLSSLVLHPRAWATPSSLLSLTSGTIDQLNVKIPWSTFTRLYTELTEISVRGLSLHFDLSINQQPSSSSSNRDNIFENLLMQLKFVSLYCNLSINVVVFAKFTSLTSPQCALCKGCSTEDQQLAAERVFLKLLLPLLEELKKFSVDIEMCVRSIDSYVICYFVL